MNDSLVDTRSIRPIEAQEVLRILFRHEHRRLPNHMSMTTVNDMLDPLKLIDKLHLHVERSETTNGTWLIGAATINDDKLNEDPVGILWSWGKSKALNCAVWNVIIELDKNRETLKTTPVWS